MASAKRKDLDIATKLKVVEQLEKSTLKQTEIAKQFGISTAQVNGGPKPVKTQRGVLSTF